MRVYEYDLNVSLENSVHACKERYKVVTDDYL